MNKSIQKLKTRKVLTSLLCSVLLFSACSTGKYGEKSVTNKTWVNWKVTFKAEVSKEKINEDLFMIDKYILDYLADHNTPGGRMYSIEFFHIPTNNISVQNIDHEFAFRVQTRFDWAGKQVVPGPTPPGPGPIFPPGVSIVNMR